MTTQSKALKYTAYSLFFIVCLIFFFLKGYPVDALAKIHVTEIQNRLNMKMTYTKVERLFPFGISFEGIRLSRENKEGSDPFTLSIKSHQEKFSILSLLFGKVSGNFRTEMLSGTIEGQASWDKSTFWVKDAKGKIDNLNLGKIDWSPYIKVNLTGKLSGNFNADFSVKDLKTFTGEANINLVQGEAGDAKVFGVMVPWFDLGKTQLNIKAEKGEVEVKDCSINSDDLEVQLTGGFTLQPRLAQIKDNFKLSFKPSDKKRSEIEEQIPEELRPLTIGKLDRAKNRSDGFYRYNISRLFSGNPRMTPLRQ
jgi:type II secretion system protein N